MGKEQRNKEQGMGKSWPAALASNRILKRIAPPLSTNYQTLNTKFGFTFIELIIVVTVIGILSTLFITQYPATQRRARDAERRSDIRQYQTAMEVFANRNNGNFPVATDIATLCTQLSISPCINDPQSSYDVESSATLYVIWARLEQPPTTATYFVSCSNGRSGITTNSPPFPTCPTALVSYVL